MRRPHLLSRDTQSIICEEQLQILQIGYLLQLRSQKGDFWAKIVEFYPRGYYDALVTSRDLSGQPIEFGDMIRIHKRHIHGIGIPYDQHSD
jgi:hypothetical protein